jgi:diguanylate cyclase (GGDEF)-like protein
LFSKKNRGEKILFAHGELNTRLSRTLKFNRFLSIAIILNLIIYSIQDSGNPNLASHILLSSSWIILGLYIILNEILLWITNKPDLSSQHSCERLYEFNTSLTTVLIIAITVFTGNSDYIFLSLIPLVQAISYGKTGFSVKIFTACAVVIFIANIFGWFEKQFLISNQNIIVTKTLSFLTVMGILTYLGRIFNRFIEFTGNKANVLHNMATTDALTGLINRREFNRRISEEFSRAKRHKSSLSLALFDIDFFKKINDTYGHNAGDVILRELGSLIASKTRTSDIACRYGGEEFALILPETSQVEAYELLDRLREIVAEEIFNKSSKPVKATISVGVAQLDLSDKAPIDFCERADKALYKAKEGGRNRVERASLGLPKIELVYKKRVS